MSNNTDLDLKTQIAVLATKLDGFEKRASEDSDFLEKRIQEVKEELGREIKHIKANSEQQHQAIVALIEKTFDRLETEFQDKVDSINGTLDKKISQSDFNPVKMIVYGMVALILTAFATVVVNFFIPNKPPSPTGS
jgi:hypothetical protein